LFDTEYDWKSGGVKMVQQSSQPSVRPEGRLATISRWATALLVIPALTGLTFAAGTVFAHVAAGVGDWLADASTLVFAIPCLIVGIGLGFPQRWAVMQIRDAGPLVPAIAILVGVVLAWMLAFLVQLGLLVFLHGFSL
jgi:hypothetical protein